MTFAAVLPSNSNLASKFVAKRSRQTSANPSAAEGEAERESVSDTRVAHLPKLTVNSEMFAWSTITHEVRTSSIQMSPTRVSGFDLKVHAAKMLAVVIRSGEATPSPLAITAFQHVLREFVEDGGPTPQLAATPSGSIEIQWLVSGAVVSALFDPTGEVNLYAQDDGGTVLFDEDTTIDAGFPPTLTGQMKTMLSDMGARITTRVTAR